VDTAQHKARLRQYFNGIGFERWSAIYGQAQLSGVRRSIREGHTTMLGVAEQWAELPPAGTPATALDAGCGTGLFTLALARRGFHVSASDLAPQMAEATARAALDAGLGDRVTSRVSDLEELAGRYHLVACFDVLIHYSSEPFVQMLRHLASLCENTLLFTYAPYSPLLAALHRVGGFFPHSQRRTEIQMIRDRTVRATLADCGFTMGRTQRVSRGFYHVTLVQARRHA